MILLTWSLYDCPLPETVPYRSFPLPRGGTYFCHPDFAVKHEPSAAQASNLAGLHFFFKIIFLGEFHFFEKNVRPAAHTNFKSNSGIPTFAPPYKHMADLRGLGV